MLKELSLAIKIGQLLVFGFEGPTISEAEKEFIKQNHVGNFILFAWNIESESQLRSFTQELRNVALESNGIEPFIAIDQEGGMVSRLPNDIATVFPGAMTIAASRRKDAAAQVAAYTAEELRSLGINFNLAPVMDVNNNPDNPVIGARSFGDTSEDVARYAIPYFKSLQRGGILSSVKHFPGHGNTAVDSHWDLPIVNSSIDRLYFTELPPFVAAIAHGADSIMTSHIIFEALDDKWPATVSSRILTGLLREELGFKGLIVSDDLKMDAVRHLYGSGEAAFLSLKAGADLVILRGDLDLQKETTARLAKAFERGEIDEASLDDKVKRILQYKKKYPLSDAKPLSAEKLLSHKNYASQIVEEALTLVSGEAAFCLPENNCRTLFLGPIYASGKPHERDIAKTCGERLGGTAFSYSLDPEPEEIEKALELAKKADQIVLGIYNSHVFLAQRKLLEELAALNKPIVLVALGSPYNAKDVSWAARATLCAYEYTPNSMNAVIKWLEGKIKAKGSVPVFLD